MNYQDLYNEYWRREDRQGEHSFQSVESVADEIQQCVGIGKVLDVGCGNGHLVRQLNLRGFDATGIDVSDVAVEVANAASPGRFQVGSILDLPFEDNTFDCVVSTDCFEHLDEEDVPKALAELRRVSRDTLYLRIALAADRDNRWHLTIQNREWWESRCFEAGTRKHPRYFLASPFGCLDTQLDNCTIVLTKIHDEVNERFPLDVLLAERELHTDMSREAGRRSDAHNMRYFEAARCIKPGDRVIDIACGLGYGSTVMTQNSRCESYLGIDNSDYAVEYANASFAAGEKNIEFEKGSLPECLGKFDDASFDFVASFETLEHLQDTRTYLSECQRILSPGGRLMISVPNDWTEEDGLDPNPHHYHVYDWGKILGELEGDGFLVERTFAKTVSRRKEQGQWVTHGYEWQDCPVEGVEQKPSEWCVVVAMKSPFATEGAKYTNAAFAEAAGQPAGNVIDFANQYENPWLFTSLLSRFLRIQRKSLLQSTAKQIIDRDRGNADEAAALCVTAYTLLGSDTSWDEVEQLLARFASHTAERDWHTAEPIQVRWAASLSYVAGLLCLQCGRRDLAGQHFEACVAVPFLQYSPVLATKTVGAAIKRATLALCDRDLAAAEHWLKRGVVASQQAVCQNWEEAFGDLTQQPLPVFH
ncbi:MAG: methyltransferase domain-containing protein, partial [Planctomycetota bacterium]